MEVMKIKENDNIEAYLGTSEQLMKDIDIVSNRWLYKLVPQISGGPVSIYRPGTQ